MRNCRATSVTSKLVSYVMCITRYVSFAKYQIQEYIIRESVRACSLLFSTIACRIQPLVSAKREDPRRR